MTYLLDVNVLLALAWPRHVHHGSATSWFAGTHTHGWATTPVTEAGFIRVSSNPRVFPDGVSPGQAAALLAQVALVAGHVFWSDTTRLADAAQQLSENVHGSRSVTDAHLALIARHYGGSLTTFDSKAAALASQLGARAHLLQS